MKGNNPNSDSHDAGHSLYQELLAEPAVIDVSNDTSYAHLGTTTYRAVVKIDTPTATRHHETLYSLLRAYGVLHRCVDIDTETETMVLVLYYPPPSKNCGNRKIRKHGSSTVVTLPESALQASGFELNDSVTVRAERGQIRVLAAD